MVEVGLGRGGDVAGRLGVSRSPVLPGEMIGVARDVGTGVLPINGLRHPPAGRSCGWYIWAGEELSSADDFFEPRHLEHLGPVGRWVLPYLDLPPGWRFLIGRTCTRHRPRDTWCWPAGGCRRPLMGSTPVPTSRATPIISPGRTGDRETPSHPATSPPRPRSTSTMYAGYGPPPGHGAVRSSADLAHAVFT